MAAGYRVIATVPDNAVAVVTPKRTSGPVPGVIWIGALDPADKISPALSHGESVEALVEFHSDVDRAAQEAVASAEGLSLARPAVLLPTHAIVIASPVQLRALAQHDEVGYIFPADTGLSTGEELMPCAGLLTLAGPVPQYANIVHGWDPGSDNKTHLGYFFGDLTRKLPASTVESEILRAFETWASVANVVFSPALSASAARAVLVEFANGAHGDAYPFDSAGQILAHTFYPVPLNPESIAGDLHLNAAVNWHAGSDTDVYSVALHEIGHALGLGHSDNPNDVMYPYYRRGMQLSANDIGAVQALYGAPGPVTAPSNAVPLSLTLNPTASPVQSAQIAISGTVSGGTPPLTLAWQTDQGYSGKGATGEGGIWNAGGVSLATGLNTVTVTAFDSAKKTASQSAVITRVSSIASAAGTGPVSIAITSPPSAVVTESGATISLSGTASGGSGIASVTWQTSGGATGTANGTGPWVAPNIPLLTGTNTITVRAADGKGTTAWASVVVVRN